MREIPFSIPRSCGLLDIFSPPVGHYLLIELSCPNGQTVLLLDTSTSVGAGSTTDAVTQPVTDTDAHFLAWASDGEAAYLKLDSLGDARVGRVEIAGKIEELNVTGWTYDLAARPNSDDFLFSFSRGLGSGSELDFTQDDGRTTKVLYSDPIHYIAFARYSPDGERISFIKIPDAATPFTVGELWFMDADGSNAHKLADVDAGHGYAANWSPDGKQLAFVVRENTRDEDADQSTESLISNIYTVDLASSVVSQITHIDDGRAETPRWSPNGNTLSFNTVIDGRMNVFTVDVTTGEMGPLIRESTCCPAWMRK